MRLAGKWSWTIVGIVLAAIPIIWLIMLLREVVIPLLIGVLFTALLLPLVQFLQKKRVPKWLAVIISLITLIAAIALLTLIIYAQFHSGYHEVVDRVKEEYERIVGYLRKDLGITTDSFEGVTQSIFESIKQNQREILSGVFSAGSAVGSVFTGLLLTIFSTIFMLIDGGRIWGWIVRLFPRRSRTAIDVSCRRGWVTVTHYVRIQIFVAFVDAVLIGLGAWALHVPLPLAIGVLVFLASFVPFFGAIVSGAVAVLLALVYNDIWNALFMLIIVIAAQQLEGHVLQPLVMGSAVSVHPLGVVVAVTSATVIAGIPGAVFAVPLVAAVNTVVKTISSGQWRSEDEQSASEDAATDHPTHEAPAAEGSREISREDIDAGVLETAENGTKSRSDTEMTGKNDD